ncbi:zinc ribbon domain-containing protein [Mumia sp. DW29H23]|uniref:zinc ribbon domain-containing protein n=1 Tax=Mumia sp. DW29H23 TaxID=3421241 RepID=UPI003D6865C1
MDVAPRVVGVIRWSPGHVQRYARTRPYPSEEPTLKADPFDQLALLEVQGLDSQLSQLAHRRKNLPQVATLEQLRQERESVHARSVRAQTTVADLTSDQTKADQEVANVRARRDRDQTRLDSGQVTSPKDLQSLQNEIVALDRRIASLEDDELEVMEELEAAQTELAAATDALASLDARIADEVAALEESTSEIDASAEAVRAERGAAVSRVAEPLLTLYQKVRASHGGVGAAALRHKRCEGCRLEINGADLREIAGKPSDEVLRCPECDRILVRTTESGL